MLKRYIGPAEFYKRALFIALPVMGQNLIQNLVSLIDSFMVSGLGDVKMSGVNIAGQILFVFMVLLGTVCTTGGIFMTQFCGADNRRGMRQSLCYKLIVSAASLVLYLGVCMVFPRPVLSLMVVGNSQAEEILDVGVRYMFLMGFMGLPMMVSTVLATSMREIGELRTPLVISVTATLINTFLNWVLIYGNLGAPRLEVAGAAYATITARTIEALLYLYCLKREPKPFAIAPKDLLHVDKRLFAEILRRGGMVIFSEMLWVLSETVCTALYNSRGGADVVSGMSASFAIANLFFVAFGGITTATSIILGKSLGAGELDTARREKEWLMGASIAFGVLMTLVGFITTLLVPVVFGNLSAASQEICRAMVTRMAVFMPFWVYGNAQFAVSRAGGDTMMGLVVDGGSILFLVLPINFVMALCTNAGPVLMYTMVKAVDLVKNVMSFFWLRREHWVKNLAEAHEK